MPVQPIPPGYHTVTPYLGVKGAAAVLEFCKHAFGAEETECVRTPDGVVQHAEVQVGDSRVMIGEANNPAHPPMPATLYLYVDDVDAWFEKAVAAGGKVVDPLTNKFYGDRSGGVQDPAGNRWYLGQHVEDVSPEEMERRMAEMQGGQ